MDDNIRRLVSSHWTILFPRVSEPTTDLSLRVHHLTSTRRTLRSAAAEFVKSVHFGGGLLKKGGSEPTQSRKEWIDQMIAESKQRKYTAKKALEETLEMTDKLDENYMELMTIFREGQMMRE